MKRMTWKQFKEWVDGELEKAGVSGDIPIRVIEVFEPTGDLFLFDVHDNELTVEE